MSDPDYQVKAAHRELDRIGAPRHQLGRPMTPAGRIAYFAEVHGIARWDSKLQFEKDEANGAHASMPYA